MPDFIELYQWKGAPLEPIANKTISWGSFGRPAKGRLIQTPNLSDILRLSHGHFRAFAGLCGALQ